MGCLHPVRIKAVWREGHQDAPERRLVPCGGCLGCRLEYSRQWAVRCMHEASLYEENCFVTLTYDDAHLPERGSLDREAFPLFMKRLRKQIAPRKVRYFHAGEYGERFGRPHYHALLFGFDPADKVGAGKSGDCPVFEAASIGEVWPFGRHQLGAVTFESAAYVARYVAKKCVGALVAPHERVDLESGEVVSLEPEYATMSRRPGIGRRWLEAFGAEVYPEDGVVCRGRLVKPPRFYDSQFELVDPETFEEVRTRRREAHREQDKRVLEEHVKRKYSLYRRELE